MLLIMSITIHQTLLFLDANDREFSNLCGTRPLLVQWLDLRTGGISHWVILCDDCVCQPILFPTTFYSLDTDDGYNIYEMQCER